MESAWEAGLRPAFISSSGHSSSQSGRGDAPDRGSSRLDRDYRGLSSTYDPHLGTGKLETRSLHAAGHPPHPRRGRGPKASCPMPESVQRASLATDGRSRSPEVAFNASGTLFTVFASRT